MPQRASEPMSQAGDKRIAPVNCSRASHLHEYMISISLNCSVSLEEEKKMKTTVIKPYDYDALTLSRIYF